MAIVSASNTVCIRLVDYPRRYLFALYSVLYFYFVYFINGTADKESWEGCHGQGFVLFIVIFLIIYGTYFTMRGARMRDCGDAHRPTVLAVGEPF